MHHCYEIIHADYTCHGTYWGSKFSDFRNFFCETNHSLCVCVCVHVPMCLCNGNVTHYSYDYLFPLLQLLCVCIPETADSKGLYIADTSNHCIRKVDIWPHSSRCTQKPLIILSSTISPSVLSPCRNVCLFLKHRTTTSHVSHPPQPSSLTPAQACTFCS